MRGGRRVERKEASGDYLGMDLVDFFYRFAMIFETAYKICGLFAINHRFLVSSYRQVKYLMFAVL